ncbi:hypothetical protein [Fodinicola acaciae]|uniref:hypothetical protein n=1 Tax=Fodinicola acaciae TaxID=2681555 RepID=UPI0013D57BFD|nr:hypothetical protein [Fodinicola acaciae]
MTNRLLADALNTIALFERAEVEIAEMQRTLVAIGGALDSTYGSLIREFRQAEADLEEIRFGMLCDEQRPAAILRVDKLKELILAEMAENLD